LQENEEEGQKVLSVENKIKMRMKSILSDADIAKTYLPMTQTVDPNHMRISLVYWLALSVSPLNRFSAVCVLAEQTSGDADIGSNF
jgi:hypothetical protein